MDTPHELTKCSHIVAVSEHNSNRWLLQSRATQLDVTTKRFSAKPRHNDVGHPALGGRIKYESIVGEELCVRWPGAELHLANTHSTINPTGTLQVYVMLTSLPAGTVWLPVGDTVMIWDSIKENSLRVIIVSVMRLEFSKWSSLNSIQYTNLPKNNRSLKWCFSITCGVSLLFIEEAIFVYRWLGTKYHHRPVCGHIKSKVHPYIKAFNKGSKHTPNVFKTNTARAHLKKHPRLKLWMLFC